MVDCSDERGSSYGCHDLGYMQGLNYFHFHRMRRFYVFFQEGSNLTKARFLKLFLSREFSHCWILEEFPSSLEDGTNWFMRVESLVNIVDMGVLVMELKDILAHLDKVLGGCFRCLVIDKQVNPLYSFNSIVISLNCVSLTKKILGINKPFLLTPRGLYKYLLKKGALEIYGNREGTGKVNEELI